MLQRKRPLPSGTSTASSSSLREGEQHMCGEAESDPCDVCTWVRGADGELVIDLVFVNSL